MGVAVHHDVSGVFGEQLRRRWAPHFMAVADVNAQPIHPFLDRSAQSRIVGGISVAADGTDRRDRPELVEHVVSADVPRVQDEIDPHERLVNGGPKEAVRVGDEADEAHEGLLGDRGSGGRPIPDPGLLPPPWYQIGLDVEVVQDAANDEVDQLLDPGWTVIESGRRRKD